MAKRLLAFLVVLLLLASCTTVRPWRPMEGDQAALESINAYGQRHAARVTLRDGSSFKARQLAVTAREVRCVDPASGEAKHVPLDQVQAIDFTLRGRGAAQGAGFGLLGGGLLGFLLTQGSSGEYMGPLLVVTATIVFALLGGGFGALGGAGGGAHVIYRVVPTIGDGDAAGMAPRFKIAMQPG